MRNFSEGNKKILAILDEIDIIEKSKADAKFKRDLIIDIKNTFLGEALTEGRYYMPAINYDICDTYEEEIRAIIYALEPLRENIEAIEEQRDNPTDEDDY